MAADLFCRVGGLSLGLTNAGFEVVLAVDTTRRPSRLTAPTIPA
jgi:site-specific DNA-cytosine methylase